MTPQMFGARGDGAHDDGPAFAAALAQSRVLHVPRGHYILSDWIHVPSNTQIYGDGESTILENTRRKTAATQSWRQRWCVFRAGHWALHHNGYRHAGGDAPFTRAITLYRCKPIADSQSSVLELRDPSASSRFAPGQLVYIRSSSARVRVTDGGVETEIPIKNTISKVVYLSRGLVALDGPVGFSDEEPLLCEISTGAHDSAAPVEFVENIRIEHLQVRGWSLLSGGAAIRDSQVREIYCDTDYLLQGNAFVRSTVDHIHGTFSTGAIEIKFCTSDAKVSNITATHSGMRPSYLSMIEVGEYNRSISISNLNIKAERWKERPLIGVLSCEDFSIKDSDIYAPHCQSQAVQIFADTVKSSRRTSVRNMILVHGSPQTLRIAGDNVYPAQQVTIEGNTFYSTHRPSGAAGILIDGGRGHRLVSNISNLPGIRVDPDAAVVEIANNRLG